MAASQTPEIQRLASMIPVSAGPWLSEADQAYDAENTSTAPARSIGPIT